MTLKEVAQICVLIRKTTFAWKNETDDEFENVIKIWHELLKDVPFDMAMKATTDYLKDSSYPPTVADIYKPYKEYLEEQKQLKREYNNIYYTAISFYPCYQDTPELKNEWNRLCGNNIPKANRLMNKIIDFVREQELADEYIPPILEWMKGLEKIE